jgi:hypothetical protein
MTKVIIFRVENYLVHSCFFKNRFLLTNILPVIEIRRKRFSLIGTLGLFPIFSYSNFLYLVGW